MTLFVDVIIGEVMSFHLSRLLGLDNVPSVTLISVNSSSEQFRKVILTQVHWQEEKVVAFIQWIENLDYKYPRYNKL